MRKYTSRYLLSFELTRICIDLYARILNLKKFKWSNINDPETIKNGMYRSKMVRNFYIDIGDEF